MSEYGRYATYFSLGSNTGTDHIVVDETDTRIETACGRTLRKMIGQITSGRGAYVHDLTEDTTVGNTTCGNCPWDEVDEIE